MFSLFKRKNNEAEALYKSILDLSQQPRLYTDYGVSDTPNGRFHMIILHAAPHFITYANAGQTKQSQALFDIIFQDIEYSFREIGVGDLAVPKKMKKYMQTFNGILQAHAARNADHVDITRRHVFGDNGDISKDFKNYIKGLFS